MPQQLDDLKINQTYVDRYGKSWVVLAFLRDAGKWFEDDPDGTHVHVMRTDPAKGRPRGRFVKRTQFIRYLAKRSAPRVVTSDRSVPVESDRLSDDAS